MDIPVELFLGLVGTSIALAIFGFIRNPQIPAMLCFGGIFILVLAVSTDNIITDTIPLVSTTEGEQLLANATQMHYQVDTDDASILNMFNSAGGQIARVEYLSNASSVLVGKELQCIQLYLNKFGSPTGTIFIGIYTNSSGSNLAQQYGTMSASSLTTTLTYYTFCVIEGNERVLQSGDRVGLSLVGGVSNSLNYIATRGDPTNPFDSTITHRQVFTFGATSWTSITASDMRMRMFDTVIQNVAFPNTQSTSEQVLYPFTELPKVLFGLIGAIFMLTGALMVAKND